MSTEPWTFGRHVDLGNHARSPLATRLNAVPSNIRGALEREGLRGATIDGLGRRIEPVDRLLDLVPELAVIVSAVIGAIHPLQAQPRYDVSHSQPRWRDRIFVSFPERSDKIGDLRLAESVVHEAMHLHLTNEENRIAFVATDIGAFYSPWMGERRPARGVLHGLFVFSCLSAFFRRLLKSCSLGEEADRYLQRRLADIAREISSIDLTALDRALTQHGCAQIRFWIGIVQVGSGTNGASGPTVINETALPS